MTTIQADDKTNNSTKMSSTPSSAAEKAVPAEKNDQIDMKKLSEAFGNFIGRNLQSPGLSFDLEGIINGIRDGAAGKPSPLSDKEYEEMMAAVQEKAFKEMSTTNLKNANDFLSKNGKEAGVIEIQPNKLQYMILTEGKGPVVEAHSSPKIHYTGKYQDGTVFGTSEEMGGPITIPLDQTIPGFSKGIIGMKEGEKRRLFVHPDLGYGTSGQLPPNELLIFDIDLVKANSDDAKKPGAVGKGHSSTDDDDDDYFFEEDEEEDIEPSKQVIPSTTSSAKPAEVKK
jgi:peptidylprolyl isomerase